MTPEEIAEIQKVITSDEAVSAFGRAWATTPAGVPGARRRAGLQAVADLVKGKVLDD